MTLVRCISPEVLEPSCLSYLDDLITLITSIVVIAAGVFALKTLSYRIEPAVSGVLAPADRPNLLIATVQVKNVGIFRARISHKSSCIRVWTLNEGEPQEIADPEKPTGVFEHKHPETKKVWISRNSTLTEVHHFPIGGDKAPAYQIRLIMSLKSLLWGNQQPEWNAETVVRRDYDPTSSLSKAINASG
jgi:hypothetical protein